MKTSFLEALVVTLAIAVVLTGLSYAHFVARKAVSHMPQWGLTVGGAGTNASHNPPRTFDFCLPSNGLQAGTAWFSWQALENPPVVLVVNGPAPINATIYNSTEIAYAGSASFLVSPYGDTNCANYSFRIYYTGFSGGATVEGTWNYTTSVPLV